MYFRSKDNIGQAYNNLKALLNGDEKHRTLSLDYIKRVVVWKLKMKEMYVTKILKFNAPNIKEQKKKMFSYLLSRSV